MKNRLISLLTGLGLIGCGGPTFVMPGGQLDGPVKPTPQDLAFVDAAGTIQLETNPAEPYSVNISCAVVGSDLYINAGDTRTRWVENIEADPRVRLRVHGEVYELTAVRVEDDSQMDAMAEAWTTKHGWWARDPRELDEAWVYQLRPR